jgi:hypothetical protein
LCFSLILIPLNKDKQTQTRRPLWTKWSPHADRQFAVSALFPNPVLLRAFCTLSAALRNQPKGVKPNRKA